MSAPTRGRANNSFLPVESFGIKIFACCMILLGQITRAAAQHANYPKNFALVAGFVGAGSNPPKSK